MVRSAVGMIAVLALAAGCGTETEPPVGDRAEAETGAHDLPPVHDRVPITPRTIAAIALDHLPQNTSSREAMYTDKRDAPGTLSPGERDLDCEISQCADLETDVEDASMVLV